MDRSARHTFETTLRRHRLAASLTQEALAERAGMSQRGIQSLEAGGRHPYPDTLERLTQALGLAGDEPGGAAPVRRAGVPGTAAGAPRSRRTGITRAAGPGGGRGALRRPRSGSPARLRADRRDSARRLGDLPTAGRPAAGYRAGGRAGTSAPTPGTPGSTGAPTAAPDGRAPRRARAAADLVRRHRLEQ